MTYTISISETLLNYYKDSDLRHIAEDIAFNRNLVEPDIKTIKTGWGYVQADKDDMENITIYAEDENPDEAWCFIPVATVKDDEDGWFNIQYESMEMPQEW